MASSMEEDESIGNYNKDGQGCGCFGQLCSGLRRNRNSSYVPLSQLEGYAEGKKEESWFIKMGKEAKEASEIIAGPKWKNFIRKFSCHNKRKRMQQFHYDSTSYALDFDNGNGCEDAPRRSFSDRFACPVGETCDKSNLVRPADC